MPALPVDIAKYTSEGVVLTKESAALKAAHPEAVDRREQTIETFFTNTAHAQALLDERFSFLSAINPVHEGIEVDESLALGTTFAVIPTIPCVRVIDGSRSIDVVCRVRAYAHETGSDRFSVEVLG